MIRAPVAARAPLKAASLAKQPLHIRDGTNVVRDIRPASNPPRTTSKSGFDVWFGYATQIAFPVRSARQPARGDGTFDHRGGMTEPTRYAVGPTGALGSGL